MVANSAGIAAGFLMSDPGDGSPARLCVQLYEMQMNGDVRVCKQFTQQTTTQAHKLDLSPCQHLRL